MNRIVLGVIGAAAVAASFGLGIAAAQASNDDSAPSATGHQGHSGGLPVVDFPLPTTAEAKIGNALAALPADLRAGARVVDYPAKAGDPYPELRAATNEWTCFPDLAPSRGDDPICYDRVGMQWVDDYYAGRDPELGDKMGVAYRLRGGSDASLTDPYAAEPAAGADWVLHGPHMVIIPTKCMDTSNLSTAPGEVPWVMNRGTPWVHIHLPVR